MDSKLRQMTESDLPMVLSWRNADDVRKNMYTNHLITPDEHHSWWKSQSKNAATRLLVFELESQPVGVIVFTKYTGKGGTATWAFYSGDRSRHGVGGRMELAALTYAFESLELRKLECEVLAFNQPVIDFHVKYGFTVEGVFRQAYQREEQYYDIYRLSMLATEWFRYVKPTLFEPERHNTNLTGKLIVSSAKISEDLVSTFSEVIGDRNPVHLDDAYAQSLGFSGRIVQGMLAGSMFSRIFANEFPGPGTIYLSQTLDFLAPISVGENAAVRLKVLSHIGRRLLVETQVSVNDKLCIDGKATVMLPKEFVCRASSAKGYSA